MKDRTISTLDKHLPDHSLRSGHVGDTRLWEAGFFCDLEDLPEEDDELLSDFFPEEIKRRRGARRVRRP